MKVCVACQSPGGLDAEVTSPLEESDMLDYYEVGPDGRVKLMAETRQCAGSCSDAVEGIARRGTDVVIVAGLSPDALLKFWNAGVRVLRAEGNPARELIKAFCENRLREIGIDEFSSLRRGK
jgi:predicted Fe-Mo cluster-binding NifX family protein